MKDHRFTRKQKTFFGYVGLDKRPPIVCVDEAAYTQRWVSFSIPLGVFVGWVALELMLLGAVVMMGVWLNNVADITYSNASGYSAVAGAAFDAHNRVIEVEKRQRGEIDDVLHPPAR